MKIISPRAFDASSITTNIPLTETAWAAGTYTLGTRRYVLPTYDLYEVVVASTTDEPTDGYAKDVKTWDRVGKVNRYACFDGNIGSVMTGTDLDMEIAPGSVIMNGMAFFNLSGAGVRVTVTDPVDGVVYDETTTAIDNSGIANWFDWYFSPILPKPAGTLTDLPLYGSATVRIRITGAFTLGELVLGTLTEIGTTGYGTQISIIDFSRKDRDTFGNAIVIRRAFANLVTYAVKVQTNRVAFVRDLLADRRATPTVYIGSDNHPATVVFGFYRDFTITLAGPSSSDCSIEVEGLI